MNKTLKSLSLAALLAISTTATAQTLTLDAASRGDQISETLYGIFFEEINHAGDGGLYAELVANRSFAKNNKQGSALEYWERYNGATITTVTAKTTAMLNDAQERCAKVTATAAGQGILNQGYKGINIVSGTTYKVSLFAKGAEAGANISVKLLAADKTTVLGEAQLGALTTDWQKLSATITATGDTYDPTEATSEEAGAEKIALDLKAAGFDSDTECEVYDIWNHQTVGTFKASEHTPTINRHGCAFYKVTPKTMGMKAVKNVKK